MEKKFKRKFNMEYGTRAYAYPYLYEHIKMVDFEIITDEVAVLIAIAYNYINDKQLKEDLKWFCELTWNINGSLRGKNIVTKELVTKIDTIYQRYENEIDTDRARFTLPIGSKAATQLELIRNKFKEAIRVLHYIEQDLIEKGMCEKLDDGLFDVLNLCSNLFYIFSLWVRCKNNENIETFVSDNYGKKKK